MINLAAIDNDNLVLHALEEIFRDSPDGFTLVTSETSVDRLLRNGLNGIDVVLLDIVLHDGHRLIDNVARIRATGPHVVLITAVLRHPELARLIQEHRVNCVSKEELLSDPRTLFDAIVATHTGQFRVTPQIAAAVLNSATTIPLTPRQTQVMRLLATGLSPDATARRLNIRCDTLRRDHIAKIKAKYEAAGRPVNDPIALYLAAVEDGLIPYPDPGQGIRRGRLR